MPERQYELLARVSASDHKRALRLYRRANWIWLSLAFASVVAAVEFYFDLEAAQSAIEATLQDSFAAHLWHAGYLLAAFFLARGIWTARVRAEITGHVFLASALATNAAAVYVLAGFSTSFIVVTLFTIASIERARYLWEVTPGRIRE